MARSHGDLKDQLDPADEVDTDTTAAAAPEVQQPAKSTAKASTTRKSPRKKSETAPAAKKTTTSRRRTTKAAPAKAEPEPEPKKPVEIRESLIEEARRVGLNLHQEEFELLTAEKVKDRINHNLRIRAMITLYESDARVRTRVNKLAAEYKSRAPR